MSDGNANDRPEQLVSTDLIKVELTIRLGSAVLTVAELSSLAPNDVLTLDRDLGDGVDICVGDRAIATGTLVNNGPDGRLGVRITAAVEGT